MLFLLITILAGRPDFDMVPQTYKQVYAQAVREGKSVLVGKVDPINLSIRAEKEGKLYCITDEVGPGLNELFPRNGKLYIKQVPTITEPSLKTQAPFQLNYDSYCPSCSRFSR
jgi:hypothetical protein